MVTAILCSFKRSSRKQHFKTFKANSKWKLTMRNKLGPNQIYVSKRIESILLLKIELDEFLEKLDEQGYISLYYLFNEYDNYQIEYYTLIKSRDEARPLGYDNGHIPIRSKEGKQIINRFLNDGDVMIFPDYWIN